MFQTDHFYMPGEVDGTSRRQYSPPGLSPKLRSIEFLPTFAATWFTLGILNVSKGSLGLLVVAWHSSKVLPYPFSLTLELLVLES